PGVRDPESVRHPLVVARIDDEPGKELLNVPQQSPPVTRIIGYIRYTVTLLCLILGPRVDLSVVVHHTIPLSARMRRWRSARSGSPRRSANVARSGCRVAAETAAAARRSSSAWAASAAAKPAAQPYW